jgi:hypothetical protein
MAPEDYTDADIRRMVKTAPNVVVVQPVRNVTVPVDVEVHGSDPGYSPDRWQHIVECSIALPTGQLQVHECTGGALLDLALHPGTYGVRVLFEGLDTLSPDGLRGHDRYSVDLWPAPPVELCVVRQWRGTGN